MIKNSTIQARYAKLRNILDNALAIYAKSKRGAIQVKHDKDLHAKMKMRLYEKKKKKEELRREMEEGKKENDTASLSKN